MIMHLIVNDNREEIKDDDNVKALNYKTFRNEDVIKDNSEQVNNVKPGTDKCLL